MNRGYGAIRRPKNFTSQSSRDEGEEGDTEPSTSRDSSNVKRRVLSSGSAEPSTASGAAPSCGGGGRSSRSKSHGDIDMDISSSDEDTTAGGGGRTTPASSSSSSSGAAAASGIGTTLAVLPVDDSAEPTPSTSSGQVFRCEREQLF